MVIFLYLKIATQKQELLFLILRKLTTWRHSVSCSHTHITKVWFEHTLNTRLSFLPMAKAIPNVEERKYYYRCLLLEKRNLSFYVSGSQYQCWIKTQGIFWTGILIITPYSWESLYSDLADWRRIGTKEEKI